MEKELTLIETEMDRIRDYFKDVASESIIRWIAERNLGVKGMAEDKEIHVTGVLNKKEEKTGKRGPYYTLSFQLDSGKTLTGSCFEADLLTGISVGTNCEVSYVQNPVNGKVYNNFTKISKSEKVAAAQKQAIFDTSSGPDRGESIDLSGCRNNAAAMIAAIVSTAKDPNEAQDTLVRLLNEQYFSNLTKTLFAEHQKVKEDLL